MFYLKNKLSPGIVALYSNRIIQGIAGGLLGIYLPIFLFEKTGSLNLILLYYFLSFGIYVFTAPLGARIATLINFRWSLIISVPLGTLFYVCLFFYDWSPVWMMTLSLVFINFDRMFYWMPYHTDFAEFTSRRDRGRVIALLTSVGSFVSIFLPIVAALIIANFGFQVLFIIVIFIYFCSLFPFLMLPSSEEEYKFSYWETWRVFFHPRQWRGLVTYAADGAQDVVDIIIWPIFIWLLLKSDVEAVGLVTSLVILTTILFRLILGKYVDAFDKKKILKYGTWLYAAGWLVKAFVGTAWQIFAVSTYHNLASVAMRSPYDTLMYEKAADLGQYVDEYSVLREMALNLGRIIMIALLFVIINFFGLTPAFILAAIISLMINFI